MDFWYEWMIPAYQSKYFTPNPKKEIGEEEFQKKEIH